MQAIAPNDAKETSPELRRKLFTSTQAPVTQAAAPPAKMSPAKGTGTSTRGRLGGEEQEENQEAVLLHSKPQLPEQQEPRQQGAQRKTTPSKKRRLHIEGIEEMMMEAFPATQAILEDASAEEEEDDLPVFRVAMEAFTTQAEYFLATQDEGIVTLLNKEGEQEESPKQKRRGLKVVDKVGPTKGMVYMAKAAVPATKITPLIPQLGDKEDWEKKIEKVAKVAVHQSTAITAARKKIQMLKAARIKKVTHAEEIEEEEEEEPQGTPVAVGKKRHQEEKKEDEQEQAEEKVSISSAKKKLKALREAKVKNAKR